ncbi:hypothetical protein HUT19_15935 [Streptomyces sp. NA02950]|nr:hypothetical protein [Streptomyces sp. NA02950]QKV93056.1 hypothetical protein HUT19_15935 [Streptomyces sp. NA02950]
MLLGEFLVDGVGQLDVLDGGDGGGDMDHQLEAFFVAGFRECVRHPRVGR